MKKESKTLNKKVRVTSRYFDIQLNEVKETGQELTVEPARAEMLAAANVAEIIEPARKEKPEES